MSRRSAPAQPSQPHLAFWDGLAERSGWVCTLIFFATLIAYLPALTAGFIWDDAGHITRLELRSLPGLGRIWFEPGATQQYYPLLHSAFWLEYHLWGDAAFGYHLLNVLLHATSACLTGIILRRLRVSGAWLAAAIFALHPVCVESVAWVMEQKNTLSGVFYLWAALMYLKFDTKQAPRQYAVATLLFLCALLSKTVTATLPAALLLIIWWQRGRISFKREIVPLLLWFILGLAAGIVTAWTEHNQIGARGEEFGLTGVQRILIAGRALWFYAGKVYWPANLIFIYPRWAVDASAAWQYLFPLGAGLVVIAVGVWQQRRRGWLAGMLFFGGTLFPALGFVDVYPFLFSFVADHFQYLACLGLIVPASAALSLAWARRPSGAMASVAVALLTVLGVLTWEQSKIYHDVFTLYETTIERNPSSWLAHNNLAEALASTGRAGEAIPHLEEALRLRPKFSEAENNLGDDLRLLGRPQDGISHFQRALQLQPAFAEAHANLGMAFIMMGRSSEGIREFEEAIRLKPLFALPRFHLGLAKARAGQTEEAIADFAAAVRLDPRYGEAEMNWGIGLLLTGHLNEALPHFERAVQLAPADADPHHNYGRALMKAKRLDDAIAQFEEALRINPNFGSAHYELALALRQAGRVEEATRHYEESVRINRK